MVLPKYGNQLRVLIVGSIPRVHKEEPVVAGTRAPQSKPTMCEEGDGLCSTSLSPTTCLVNSPPCLVPTIDILYNIRYLWFQPFSQRCDPQSPDFYQGWMTSRSSSLPPDWTFPENSQSIPASVDGVTDSGAQSNVWSLSDCVASGYMLKRCCKTGDCLTRITRNMKTVLSFTWSLTAMSTLSASQWLLLHWFLIFQPRHWPTDHQEVR